MKQMVNAVLIKIQEMSGVELEGIDSYMNETRKTIITVYR